MKCEPIDPADAASVQAFNASHPPGSVVRMSNGDRAETFTVVKPGAGLYMGLPAVRLRLASGEIGLFRLSAVAP